LPATNRAAITNAAITHAGIYATFGNANQAWITISGCIAKTFLQNRLPNVAGTQQKRKAH
jgi:hypothetical protein